MLREQHYRLTDARGRAPSRLPGRLDRDEAEKAFRDDLEKRREQPRFANGRSVRNAIDRARMRHAIRIYDTVEEKQKLTKADLVTFSDEDITKSRVFDQGAYGDVPERAES